jgi:molybdopterin/thiamine biosynthesis adenylyltransferase
MYNELTSRNVGLLTPEEQEIIRNLKVGIPGCGMGSFIAESLVRLGVEKIIVADPDIVELCNLNHQNFYTPELSKNKALVIKEHLRMINPKANIEAWPEAVNLINAGEFVDRSNIVIDAIDPLPGIPISKKLAEECTKERKYFLYPMDVGWGALVLCFDPNGDRKFEKIIGEGDPLEMLNNLLLQIQSLIQFPEYIVRVWEEVQHGALPHYPQPITASLTAATLVTSVIVKIAKREDPPFLMYFDPFSKTFMGGVT